MYTLSTWYTKEQLTKRIAIFFFGMFGGNAVAPLLGAGLLRLDVEGIMSMVAAIALFFLLPEKPNEQMMKNNFNDGTDERSSANIYAHNKPISYQDIWKTLGNIRKWPHFIATACVFSTWSPLTTYTPSIIMSLGFSRIESNAISAIGNFATLPVILFFAWLSDKTKRHGLIVTVAIAAYLIALILLRIVQPHVGQWSRIGLWTTVNGLAVGYHPIHNAWIQINCNTAAERSISVAYVQFLTHLHFYDIN
ncbi:MFS general substrate transporter [Aspergillus affinis]|uniref:MFS general substrate transporter n=1 Tax=Aspergillus affinis TaxID=1070780 RepID=UPI0022FEC333|nr:MFS general substrate transporter [Aspergillus affinis]KAI9040806.1 MFS general substrate transporter [Aspergillus affinis]